MRIDSHQHFWFYEPREYPWIQKEWNIRKDFLPHQLRPILERHGLDGCVAVQARQSLEESRWLLEVADRAEIVRGVVGWVDLRSPEVDKQLASFASHSKFVGVRHVVQDEPDDRFVLQERFIKGISKLERYGLTYDLLLYPKQLPASIELVRRFPDQPFVLDHISKPLIAKQVMEPWRADIQKLAEFPNVYCKVSGMVTEAEWNGWKREDFHPYLDVVVEAFGPSRIMYGSDWPVCLLSAEYDAMFGIIEHYFQSFSDREKAGIFGGNAIRFYGLS
ncbi:MAG: amidohydrolase family protein [Pirellulales bacterium]